jgi:hypothetical protein
VKSIRLVPAGLNWDLIEYQLDSRRENFPSAKVMSIGLAPARLYLACVLVRQRGRPLRLSPEVAPFDLIRDALDETLIPELVQRLDRRLGAGELVAIRASLPRSLLAIAEGLSQCLSSVILILNPLRMPLAIAVFRNGILVMRQGWLGIRGGFTMSDRGLCPRSNGDVDPIPWGRLERIHASEVGLVVRSRGRGGLTFGVSGLAEDFWPALRWINARLPQADSMKSDSSDWRFPRGLIPRP